MSLDDLTIAIVSHLRWKTISTHEFVPSAKIVVAESQAAAYRAACPDHEVVTHPDAVKGLPAKRQWIIERMAPVFMLDDDVVAVIDTMRSEADRRAAANASLRGQHLEDLILRLHHTAQDLGVYLWGFIDGGHPQMFVPQYPLILNSYIHGAVLGVEPGGGLFFNTSITHYEDMWICALNAHLNRLSVKDIRVSFNLRNTMGSQAGGMSDVRVEASYERDLDVVRTAFGDVIHAKWTRRYRQGGGLVEHAPKGEHHWSLSLPF